MSFDESGLSVDDLLKSVASTSKDQPLVWNKTIAIANAKMGMENNRLTQRTQELTEEQIEVSRIANDLTEKLLISNERASKDSERSAELMNSATQQLAQSTKWLTIATFALVLFAAIQALTPFLALHQK